MRSPLTKRVPREIKAEAGKYIVIFIIMTLIIGGISGYLVADESLKKAYDDSFEKYNVEDGNFEIENKADSDLIKSIEEEKVTLYENFYQTETTNDFESTVRIFKDRKDVNKVCVWEGEMPKNDGEIALNRLYLESHDLNDRR